MYSERHVYLYDSSIASEHSVCFHRGSIPMGMTQLQITITHGKPINYYNRNKNKVMRNKQQMELLERTLSYSSPSKGVKHHTHGWNSVCFSTFNLKE